MNADSRLQVVLWEPNKNLASKIINEVCSSNSNDSDKNMNDQEQLLIDEIDLGNIQVNVDYNVEEPSELSPKKSLKR